MTEARSIKLRARICSNERFKNGMGCVLQVHPCGIQPRKRCPMNGRKNRSVETTTLELTANEMEQVVGGDGMQLEHVSSLI